MSSNDDIQTEINSRILKQIIPALFAISILSIPVLLSIPHISFSRLVPSIITLTVVIVSYTLLKLNKIRIATASYFAVIYLSIFWGMFKNGGAYAPIFASLIAMGGTTAVFFSRRTTIFVFLATQLLALTIVSLYTFKFLTLPAPLSQIQYYVLNLFYHVLLLHAMLLHTKMLKEAYAESKEKSKKIEESQSNLETVIESIGEGMVVLNAEGEIVKLNHAGAKLLTLAWEKCHHIPFPAKIIQSGSEVTLKEIIEDSPHFYHQVHLTRSDETSIPVNIAVYPLLHEESIGTILTIRDISEELLLHEQSLQRQKMEAVGQLSSGVAHDFNNMLAGILGACDLLDDEPLDQTSQEYISIIRNAADSASELTSKLLNFSRKGSSEESIISIHKALNNAVAILKRTVDKSIDITINLNAENDLITGDLSQIQNSLLNMGINASHAMPYGGKLIFETSVLQLDATYCDLSPFDITPGKYIELSIKDNGTGISPENIQKIFDPFFTTKEQGEGTGLGLAAVRNMVESHNGAISVYSEEGNGTMFHLYFPPAEQESSDESAEQSYAVVTGSQEKILLIDDEEMMLIIGKKLLEQMNYSVDVARNGEEGVIAFRENRYDLVILDMVMPGMNGKETFLQLQAADPTVKVILSSGFTRDDDVEHMKENGLAGFIKKPYRREEFSMLVAEVLSK